MDIIANANVQPDMQQIGEYITGEAGALWHELNGYIARTFVSKPQIAYSVCAAKPGWNVKYKKRGRALCTLYPERKGFVALVVLSEKDQHVFDMAKPSYTRYVRDLYRGCKPLGSTRWLMITVSDKAVLQDVVKLLHLKLDGSKKSFPV